MDSIAISKEMAEEYYYGVGAGQELLALGLSFGAVFSSHSVTGSSSRSAVDDSTGGVTQLAGVITSSFVVLVMLVLTPLFYYLPSLPWRPS